jgi:hypothetical protein
MKPVAGMSYEEARYYHAIGVIAGFGRLLHDLAENKRLPQDIREQLMRSFKSELILFQQGPEQFSPEQSIEELLCKLNYLPKANPQNCHSLIINTKRGFPDEYPSRR